MKVALCISGQPRGIPFSIKFIRENLVDPNGITDIFIHTWYHKDWDNRLFDSAQPNQNERVGSWKPQTDALLQKFLEPISMVCDKPNPFEEYSNLPQPGTCDQSKIASLFYGMWKANELKREHEIKTGEKYDLVIRTRLDLVYKKPVILPDLLANINYDSNSVYTPAMYQEHRMNDSYSTSTGTLYSSMADTFAFGSSETMDKFCSVYPNFLELHKELYPYVYGESYLGYQVRHAHKLKIECLDINYEIMHRIMDVDSGTNNY